MPPETLDPITASARTQVPLSKSSNYANTSSYLKSRRVQGKNERRGRVKGFLDSSLDNIMLCEDGDALSTILSNSSHHSQSRPKPTGPIKLDMKCGRLSDKPKAKPLVPPKPKPKRIRPPKPTPKTTEETSTPPAPKKEIPMGPDIVRKSPKKPIDTKKTPKKSPKKPETRKKTPEPKPKEEEKPLQEEQDEPPKAEKRMSIATLINNLPPEVVDDEASVGGGKNGASSANYDSFALDGSQQTLATTAMSVSLEEAPPPTTKEEEEPQQKVEEKKEDSKPEEEEPEEEVWWTEEEISVYEEEYDEEDDDFYYYDCEESDSEYYSEELEEEEVEESLSQFDDEETYYDSDEYFSDEEEEIVEEGIAEKFWSELGAGEEFVEEEVYSDAEEYLDEEYYSDYEGEEGEYYLEEEVFSDAEEFFEEVSVGEYTDDDEEYSVEEIGYNDHDDDEEDGSIYYEDLDTGHLVLEEYVDDNGDVVVEEVWSDDDSEVEEFYEEGEVTYSIDEDGNLVEEVVISDEADLYSIDTDLYSIDDILEEDDEEEDDDDEDSGFSIKTGDQLIFEEPIPDKYDVDDEGNLFMEQVVFDIPSIPVLESWKEEQEKQQAMEREARDRKRQKPRLPFIEYGPEIGPEVAPRTPRNVMMAILSAGELDFKLRVVPKEHKKSFVSVAEAATSIGRLTKLKEVTVESVSTGAAKKVEEEWSPSGEPIVLQRSISVKISNEAAAMGKVMRLIPHVVTNYDESSFLDARRFFEQREQEIDIEDEVDEKGYKAFRTDVLIHRHFREYQRDLLDKDWNMNTLDTLDEQEHMEFAELPTEEAPHFNIPKPSKPLTSQEIREGIAQGVAERWWDRKYRLDRPKKWLKIKDHCTCKYCKTSNPFQTHAYKQLTAHNQ